MNGDFQYSGVQELTLLAGCHHVGADASTRQRVLNRSDTHLSDTSDRVAQRHAIHTMMISLITVIFLMYSELFSTIA